MDAVLIIDDEENLRKLLSRVIELEGYHVLQAANAKDGLALLSKERVQVVVTDVKLPDGNGVQLTEKIKQLYPSTEVIVITAFGTIQDGVNAIKNGAFDYLTKGDHQEKIIPLVAKAAEKSRLQQKILQLESQLESRFGFTAIIGEAKLLKESINLAQKVAATDSTVLLLGETGTGKEVFAQAIHYSSKRKAKPFVALNCSAFAKDLLESELFGHAAGAFTGALHPKSGYLEEAHEGTLFLDEIGEMNTDLQAKLLRVLETGEFYRVGESKPKKVNVRFIAATNRDIENESNKGSFRQDLYYRLNVFAIKLPALRDRKEDIPAIANHYVREFSLKTNRKMPAMSHDFIRALQQHRWPGNIRELKNVIERAVILADNELVPSLLPGDFNNANQKDSLDLATVEIHHIRRVLAQTHGNKTQTAKLLGIGLTTLYQKIKDYKLGDPSDKE